MGLLSTDAGLRDLPGLADAAFDLSAGAAGSLERLKSIESDGRWRHRYVIAAGNGRLEAFVPVYWPAGGSWPDQAYAPESWAIDGRVPDDEQCLLVGGVYDRRTALHVPAPLAGECLREVARVATEAGRGLAFPFVYERSRRLLDAAGGGRIRWRRLRSEAQFPEVLRPGGEGARVRGVLRRDRRLIEQAATTASVVEWEDADLETHALIAAHNVRKGQADHAEFVRLRYAQWTACVDVQVLVFDARAGGLRGVLTALVWRGGLELQEIGLPESDDPARLALYLDLLFHRPFAYARANGLSSIRAGTAARTPKASRGAVFEPLYGGVLDAGDTRRLASEE